MSQRWDHAVSSNLDLPDQHTDIDQKIVVALERVAQALRTLLWQTAKERQITPLQLQCLLYLALQPPEQCRVSHLADMLDLTRATISQAIKTLEEKGLVYREPWERDRRVALLRLTPRGDAITDQLAAWSKAIRESLALFPMEEKELVMRFLMQLIASLQKEGIITIARMCITCVFFQPNAHPGEPAPHHCRLLDQPLTPAALRMDCPDYQPASARER